MPEQCNMGPAGGADIIRPLRRTGYACWFAEGDYVILVVFGDFGDFGNFGNFGDELMLWRDEVMR